MPAGPRSVEEYAKVGVTDLLLVLHSEDPARQAEQIAALLPRLREIG